MVGDLKFISYGSDAELKDPARLKRLSRHAQHGNYLAVILPCLFFGVPILTGMGWLAFGMIVSPKFRPFWYMELILAGLGALSFLFCPGLRQGDQTGSHSGLAARAIQFRVPARHDRQWGLLGRRAEVRG